MSLYFYVCLHLYFYMYLYNMHIFHIYVYYRYIFYMYILYINIIKAIINMFQVTFKQNHHQNILHIFYLKGMIQIVDIRVSNSPLFILSKAAERWSFSFCFGSNSFFSRIVIKNCINATNYDLQGTRNPMLLCDGTQLSCKHPFTIIILINPAKNNSLWDFKEIIS